MRLILARHGQSLANVDPLYMGKDSELTPLGEQQADRLGRWLLANEPDLDLILCSPLRRARQTAAIVNQYLKLPLEIDEDLAEINRFDLPLLWRREHPFSSESAHLPPGTDGYYEEYKACVRRALHRMTADLLRPRPVLIVSHGGTSGTLLRLILERDDIYFWTRNTAMHFVQWLEGCWRIEGLNQTPHLSPEMLS